MQNSVQKYTIIILLLCFPVDVKLTFLKKDRRNEKNVEKRYTPELILAFLKNKKNSNNTFATIFPIFIALSHARHAAALSFSL